MPLAIALILCVLRASSGNGLVVLQLMSFVANDEVDARIFHLPAVAKKRLFGLFP